MVIALSVAMPALAKDGVDDGNSWCELDPGLREIFQRIIKTDNALNDADFTAWYKRWYCAENSASQEPPRPCVPDVKLYPGFFYNHRLGLPYRVSATCVLSKLATEFPDLVTAEGALQKIENYGISASFSFSVRDEETLKIMLVQKGYTDSAGAALGHEWGYRSAKPGAQLHFKRDKGDTTINVHIDRFTPRQRTATEAGSNVDRGISGLMYLADIANHVERDLLSRDENYSPAQIVRSMGPLACGLGLTDLAALSISVGDKTTAAVRAPSDCTPLLRDGPSPSER